MAKRYIEPVDRSVYFEDVQLQMEAKLWGEEYNRHKPPKQVHEPYQPPSYTSGRQAMRVKRRVPSSPSEVREIKI